MPGVDQLPLTGALMGKRPLGRRVAAVRALMLSGRSALTPKATVGGVIAWRRVDHSSFLFLREQLLGGCCGPLIAQLPLHVLDQMLQAVDRIPG